MSDRNLQVRRNEIDAKAREWMSYLYSGEMTERGRAGFRAWLAESADHRAAFQALNDLWTSLDRLPGIENGAMAESQNESNAIRPESRQGLLQLAARLGLAAALVATIAALVTLATLHMTERVDERHFAAEVGQVRTLGLTDGSQLVLRADTAIVASMSRDERSVTIERGGAYFDVSRDETRPFVVSAGSVHIRVLGTTFDVLKGPSSITVSVTHGHVEVSEFAHENRRDANAAQLTRGQQLTIEADGTFGAIVNFDAHRVLAWREGRLSYVNARLEDIVADINRYRTNKIIIEDATLEDLRITTMFRVENADQMLAGIEATEPVTIVRSPSSITIRRRATR